MNGYVTSEETGEMQIITHDGFLTDDQYQRGFLREQWERSGMRSLTEYIEREGLTVLDSPVGRWTRITDRDHSLVGGWRYRVEAWVETDASDESTP